MAINAAATKSNSNAINLNTTDNIAATITVTKIGKQKQFHFLAYLKEMQM